MNFECISHNDGITESWKGEIVYFSDSANCIEMNIQSRSSIDIIIGTTQYGNYVCIPNFEVGCYLSSFDDIFFNTERLSRLIGKVDGVTVATAIKSLASKLYL